MADTKTPEERSRNMGLIRSKNTKPEVIFRKWMFAEGFRYSIAPQQVKGKPDMWMPKYKTAVFINGCFWHQHSGCRYCYMPKSNLEYWQKKLNSNKERDRRVYQELDDAGIACLVIWECTIKKMRKDTDYRLNIIEQASTFIKRGNGHLEL